MWCTRLSSSADEKWDPYFVEWSAKCWTCAEKPFKYISIERYGQLVRARTHTHPVNSTMDRMCWYTIHQTRNSKIFNDNYSFIVVRLSHNSIPSKRFNFEVWLQSPLQRLGVRVCVRTADNGQTCRCVNHLQQWIKINTNIKSLLITLLMARRSGRRPMKLMTF